jgi:hypothetical protein
MKITLSIQVSLLETVGCLLQPICVSYPNGDWIQDSITAFSGFNNDSSFLHSSSAQTAYIYEVFANGKKWKDIALLGLKDTLGKVDGWVGLKSISKKELREIQFIEFSYRAESEKKYMQIDKLSVGLIGVRNKSAFAKFGESGNSIIYSSDLFFYAVGILSYSEQCQHYHITVLPKMISLY